MKTLLTSILLLAFSVSPLFAAGIEKRSEPVCVALEESLKKKRTEIDDEDLAKVTSLKLPHIHIKSFKDDDFTGLKNMKKLHFFSLLHNQGKPTDPVAINNEVFAGLSNLEELIMTEQLGLLPDEVFSGLTSLKILDLTNATLNRLPKTMLTMPNIESIYYNGRGLSKEDYETLKKALGDKLKEKRAK